MHPNRTVRRKNKILFPEDKDLTTKRVMIAIKEIMAHPYETDDELVKVLADNNIPQLDAELLIGFIPSAFARVYLKEKGLHDTSDYYTLLDKKGNLVDLPLADEHYFLVAQQIATDFRIDRGNSEIDQQTFETIAANSAEMQAVNELIKGYNRQDLSELSLTSLAMLRISIEDVDSRIP